MAFATRRKIDNNLDKFVLNVLYFVRRIELLDIDVLGLMSSYETNTIYA